MENPPAQYPPVTKNEYNLIAFYLHKFELEDEENVDDSMYYVDYEDDDYRVPNAHQVVRRFLKQVRESRGYDVDCSPPFCLDSPFIPRNHSMQMNKEYRDKVIKITNFAISQINAQTGKTYKLVDVEKVVETLSFMMLLTFTAKEVVLDADADAIAHTDANVHVDAAAVKTFQAMVYVPLFADLELEEWRFKPLPVAIESQESDVFSKLQKAELEAEKVSSSEDEASTPTKKAKKTLDSVNFVEEDSVKRSLNDEFSSTASKKTKTMIKQEEDN